MTKEPFGLYLFRYVVSMGFLFLIGMLFWSSSLLEKDVKNLSNEVDEVQQSLSQLRTQLQTVHADLLKAVVGNQRQRAAPIAKEEVKTAVDLQGVQRVYAKIQQEPEAQEEVSADRPQIDPKLPNLLQEDHYYADVLPKQLGDDFHPQGIFHDATVAEPDNLHPFSNWSEVSSWIGQCTVNAATGEFGKYETMASDVAIKMEMRESKTGVPEFWVHLRDKVFWAPLNPKHFPDDLKLDAHFLQKHLVTAHDFKFYFDALMNPSVQEAGAAALRTYLGDIEELRVVDDLTFVVRWKGLEVADADGKKSKKIKYAAKNLTGGLQPLPRFVYQYFADGTKIIEDDQDPNSYRTNSVWAQNFAQHWARNIIVSCGPWLFDGKTKEAIRFKRNPDHYNPYAVLVESQEVRFRESPDSIWQDFKAGKIDAYAIRPDQLIEYDDFLKSSDYLGQAQKGMKVNRVDYISRAYNYVGWNQARPQFASKKMRRAMTMAIDRRRIIEQNLNRMGSELTGPFHPFSPSNNKNVAAWPFDPAAARRLLEEEGWYDSDGDGIVDKIFEGKRVPFRFSLTYFVKNPTAKANCEYISTALKEIGVDCLLNGVDISDLSKAWDEKSFDAIYLGWALGSPPEDPKQLWHSSGAKEKGSSNGVGFQNKEADEIIEKLQYEYDQEKRLALYHRFHEIIHEEAPYTFLYTPKTALLYREYMQNVFIPANRQDLIPGANVAEPSFNVIWIKAIR